MSLQRVIRTRLFIDLFGTLETNRTVKNFLYNYLLAPLNNGLIGFAIVFTVIISVKFSEKIFTGTNLSYVSLDDLATASVGLVIFGAGRIILNFIYSITKTSRANKTPE